MKWFAYSPDGGMSFHDTPEEAKAWAQREIDDCREAMDDLGWEEELVSGICWGEVKQKSKEIGNCTTGFDYELESVDGA